MPFRLRTFGGLSLTNESGPVTGLATQRRKLALLTVLATGGERGVSRDRLLALFWPESDTEHARHALTQTLSALRRDLASEDLFLGTADLRLNPAIIESDVAAFAAAVERGDLEGAAALYTGPFLDAVHLDHGHQSPEFERWADRERVRLAGLIAHQLERLAVDAGERSEHMRAVACWRRLAALDPYSARFATGLITALVAAGEAVVALRHAELYETLLREELNLKPDEAVLAMVRRLRRGTERPPGPPPRKVDEPGPPRVAPEGANTAGEALEARPHRRSTRRLAGLGALAAAVLVMLSVTRFAWKSPRAGPGTAASTGAIAVLPFTVHGSNDLSFLSDGIVHLLSKDLDGAGGLRSVDPYALLGAVARPPGTPIDPEHGGALARRFGASRFVLGDVVQVGEHVRISASLYDPEKGKEAVGEAMTEGSPAQLFRLVDELAEQLIAEQRHGPREHLARIAALTTYSLPALKDFLKGERDYRGGLYASAVDAFTHATATDTTFALAYFRLSNAADWAGMGEPIQRAARQALRLSRRLSEHDRLLVQGYAAWRRGDNDGAEPLYRRLVHDYPDDLEAWYQLGEVLFHGNSERGRSFTEARDAFEHVLALEPDSREALVHLARIAAREQKRSELDALLTRALRLAPPDEARELRVFHAFTNGDSAAQTRALAELRGADRQAIYIPTWRVAVYGRNLPGAERIAQLALRPGASPDLRQAGYLYLSQLELGRGRWRSALAQLDSLGDHDPAEAAEQRVLLYTTLRLWVPPSPTLGTLQQNIDPGDSALKAVADPAGMDELTQTRVLRNAYLSGLVSLLTGDTATVLKRAAMLSRASRRLVAAQQENSWLGHAASRWAGSLTARVAWPRNSREALRTLETSQTVPLAIQTLSDVHDRFALAELLRANGREREALGWYTTIADITPAELAYLGPSYLRQGETLERLGSRALAADAYRRLVTLWRDCDPELRPLAAYADRRLRSLR